MVELKEKAVKLAGMTGASGPAASEPKSQVLEEAGQALINLGYSRNEAEKALRRLSPGETDLGTVIKEALKELSRL
jgi:Holliday junction resolvasome RuvABC DNA-binding subunit